MWEKRNLKQFNIRQQHNKIKKMKGYEYFRKALQLVLCQVTRKLLNYCIL